MKKKILSLLLSACMLASLMVAPASAASFKDADAIPDWAKESVERWTDAGVLSAQEDGNFDPTHELTRAEFAILLCNLMGYTEKADRSTFKDLPGDAEAADALLKLAAAGVMVGIGDNQADPNGTLTREQTACMMFRALNMKADPAAAAPEFADSDDISDWAKAEMAAMTSAKMLVGDGTSLLPGNNIPKQDMAALLDGMIAAYVTKDGAVVNTKDAANPNGAVIIKANNVKIEDASESGSIVVAPGAPKNTSVTVAGEATDITIAAEGAKVTVNKDAQVGSVTAAAESAKVTVAKGGEVGEISAEAPKAAVEVSGTVGSVMVAEGADNTTVTAKSGAKVESVTTSAESVKVNGANKTIGTVVAEAGSADVKAKGSEVTANEGAAAKVDGKPVSEGSTVVSNQTGSGTSSSSGGSSSGGGSSTPDPVMKTLTVSVFANNVADHNTQITSGESNSVEVGKEATVTVTSKKNIAVVLTYEGADKENGAKPRVTTTGDADKGFTYTITFTMPSTDAKLVIGVLNACETDPSTDTGLSSCYGGDNTDEGVLEDGISGWGTSEPDEPTPEPENPGQGEDGSEPGEGGDDTNTPGGDGTEGGGDGGSETESPSTPDQSSSDQTTPDENTSKDDQPTE